MKIRRLQIPQEMFILLKALKKRGPLKNLSLKDYKDLQLICHIHSKHSLLLPLACGGERKR